MKKKFKITKKKNKFPLKINEMTPKKFFSILKKIFKNSKKFYTNSTVILNLQKIPETFKKSENHNFRPKTHQTHIVNHINCIAGWSLAPSHTHTLSRRYSCSIRLLLSVFAARPGTFGLPLRLRLVLRTVGRFFIRKATVNLKFEFLSGKFKFFTYFCIFFPDILLYSTWNS